MVFPRLRATGSRTLALVTLLGAVGSGPAHSQRQTDNAIQLPSLAHGSRVRIESERRQLEGVFLRGDAGALLLSSDEGERRVRMDSVSRLWTRGRATKTGAIVGAIAGGAFGVFVGAVTNSFCSSGFFDVVDPCPEAIPILGLGGSAIGGAVGAGVGALIPKWHRRYP